MAAFDHNGVPGSSLDRELRGLNCTRCDRLSSDLAAREEELAEWRASGEKMAARFNEVTAERDEWKRKAEEAARDSARLDFLLKLWPLEIVRLIHSHHTHGPSSSIPREAIDAAIAAKGEA